MWRPLALVAAASVVRSRRPELQLPFRMWLYPLPSAIALAGWLAIVAASGPVYVAVAAAIVVLGIGAYLWRAKRTAEWPFER